MKLKIGYKKNEHQNAFHEELSKKFLHLSTGFGGGKTYSLCMKLMQLSFLNRPFPGGLVVPTFGDFKRDVLPELEQICDINNIKIKHHISDHWIRFPWSRGKLWYVSAEKKIRGPNWAYAGINEATLITRQRYNETVGRVRVRGAPFPIIASSGTPEGYGHWMQEMFDEKPIPNSRIIYGDTRDNIENLNPSYIQSLMDSYDDNMLDAYLKGLWVNLNSKSFYYAYDPKVNQDASIVEPRLYQIIVGMDFNVDPMTATIWFLDGDGILSGFDEIKILDGDTYKMCRALKARGYNPERVAIYPDPAGKARRTSGKSDIKILREEGFSNIIYKSKAGELRTRQLNMNKLLETGRIKFNPDKMPEMKKDFANVQVDRVTGGKNKKDQERTHYSDGLDYICEIIFPFEHRPKKQSTAQKFR